MRIENHAQQRAPSRPAAAIGKQGIVSQYRSYADQNCIALVTLFLDVGARSLAGDPSAGRSFPRTCSSPCSWRSDLAIERHRGLQRHQRNAVANVAGESLVQTTGFRLESPDFDLNARRSQRSQSLARSPWDWDRAWMRPRDELRPQSKRRCTEACGLDASVVRD